MRLDGGLGGEKQRWMGGEGVKREMKDGGQRQAPSASEGTVRLSDAFKAKLKHIYRNLKRAIWEELANAPP
jgi:hypothetical protein